ncbi:paraquat-inducible protein A [Ferrimonas marina]|uniref:Paraquat-inducible protein A n=1 Tax=Ferrimonas marina TaxID=299255 RepID=A0A1M5NHI1_9GAMM|nr:paraquat-inducible protein A [Ferrimonas marina]SHG88927.1 paraquat-inducible protein A [Ferrimonas marina]
MAIAPILCPTCDAQVRHRALPVGLKADCPRCGSRLYDRPFCDLGGLAALTLSALMIYFPANLMPIIEINLVGNLRATTVLHGALTVIEQGYYLVGLAVILAGIVAPLLLLLSVLAQLVLLELRIGQGLLKQLLLHHPTLNELSMVEIYMISMLVSVFKLTDIADLTFGWGTLCYILLFIMIFYVQYEYNPQRMWHHYEQRFS